MQSDRLFRARSRRSHARGSRAALEFAKYHGLGNDFILLDNRESHDLAITSEEAKKLCDRSFGVGADGVILATPPFDGTGSQYGMRIFNADGSEAEMCGNGIRCLARFVAGKDGGRRGEVSVSTLAGEMKPTLLADDRVAVDMGPPSLQPGDIPTTLAATTPAGNVVQSPLDGYLVTAVGMGNPHAVIFSTEDGAELNVDSLDLERIGPPLENHDAFPSRANVEFVSVISDNHLRMRVWERGSGQTLACGTGATPPPPPPLLCLVVKIVW